MGATWSIPYGNPAPNPFWGPPTSAVNFCEGDYIVTRYIAEFFNTLTSLTYIGYGLLGIRRHRRLNVGPFSSVNLPYWGLMGVGTFSGLYHCTLKYHTQMSDELSMHLAIGTILHQIFTFQQPPAIQRRNTTIILGILVPFVIYHCLADEFALHVILFLSMTVLVIWKTNRIISAQVHEEIQRKKIKALATSGAATAGIAYALWNIDVHLCSTLTSWKQQLGWPWSAFLELHGYWHILTAISSYTFMALIEFLTCMTNDETDGVGFIWPAKAVLQELKSVVSANGGDTISVNGNDQWKRK